MRPDRCLLLLCLAVSVLEAGLNPGFNPETGSYVFTHYSPSDYHANAAQNWAIAQDQRGVMYFGNTDGLLEFDGAYWRLLRLPNRTIVRSVTVDSKGTVYLGAEGDFGYLQPDSSGMMKFVSLLPRVPEKDRNFADVWRVLPTPQGIYFSTLSKLFRMNPDGTIKVWHPQKKFGRAFYVIDALYVQTAGQGLMQMRNDELSLVPGGEPFAADVINAAVPMGDHAIFATATRLYKLTREAIEPLSPVTDPRLTKSAMSSMQALPDGALAVGTKTGGLFFLNTAGAVERVVSKASGLADDYVSAIYSDRQGGIWLAQQNGITRFNPGLSRYGKDVGLEGDVESMTRHRGSIYAGTTTGVFRLISAQGLPPQFERVEGIANTVWTLTSYGNDLLAANDLGVFLISGAHARRIYESTRPVFDLSASRHDPDVVYVARRTSVVVLRRLGLEWKQEAVFESQREEFRSVLEDSDGKVWATSKGKIWRLDFSAPEVRSEEFSERQGVPAGWINVRRLQGHIVFATTKGLKQYSRDLKRFAPDVTLGSQFADGSRDVFNIFDDHSGKVWVTGEGYHGVLTPQPNGGYKWLPMPLLRSGIQEIYWMSLDDDGTPWAIGADNVLQRWESGIAGDPNKDFRVLTRSVQLQGEKEYLYGGAGAFDSASLSHHQNAMRLTFAAPFYEDPASVEYQSQLEGSDRGWSDWSHETHRDYTNLWEGSYRFHVRARNPHGVVTEQSDIGFGVLPPWHRTWWAYSIYLICAGFAMWGLVKWRTRKLVEEKHQLEVIVEERTVEIREQRDEIQVQERKSQALLLNILPAAVADELKSTGAVQPVGFDDVTVCFTDFVGFTLSSEKLPPGKLVDSLNEYFTAFDEIIARYGLEKLKTIGDSYMFASGLPTPRKSHAVDAVLAAMEMAQVVKALAVKPGSTAWGIRIGLHSGPVVAGVVGIRKFAFDIWGNTVNFAARMESSGVPGHVNMSERTCRLLRELIDCDFRGNVKIKEGRELPMFLARRPAFIDRESFADRYEREFGETLKSFPDLTVAANVPTEAEVVALTA